MALDYQKVPVPVSQGLAGDIDDRLVPVGKMLHARNVVWDKKGRVSKRPGFNRFTMDLEDGGTLASPSRLLSAGDEVCCVHDNHLHAWSPSAQLWLDRGRVSPFCGHQRVNWADRLNFAQADLHESTHSSDNLIAYVAATTETYEGALEVNRVRGVSAGTYDKLHRVVHERQVLQATNSTIGKPHAVKAFGCSTKLLVSWLQREHNETGDAGIHIWETTNTAPEDGYRLGQMLDDAYHEDYNIRTYDVIDLETGNYAVAWCRFAVGDLRVETFNAAHNSQIARDIAPPADCLYRRVAICDDPNLDQILMMTVREHTPTGQFYLEAWALDRDATLATNWGPVAIDNVANDDRFENLGPCLWDLTHDSMVCVWGEKQTLAAPVVHGGWRTGAQFFAASTGVARSSAGYLYNSIPYSKPFSDDTTDPERAFCIISTNTYDNLSYVYEARGCYELVLSGGAQDPADFYHCGTWNPGINNSHRSTWTLRLGSCQNTVQSRNPNGVWRVADVVRDDTRYDPLVPTHRYGCTTVELDFKKKPATEQVDRGCTAIGGGMVQLYDGARVDEVSFVFPPVIAATAEQAGTGVDPGTYYYTTMWETYDHAGNWHRSAPSRQWTESVSEECGALRIYTRSLPQSIRRGDGDQVFAVTFFRNDATGSARVVNEPETATRNWGYGTNAAYLNPYFDDDHTVNAGRFLYTDSGELEPVPPMGSSLVMTQNERVWLGDMFRPDFVQFSKRYTPGLATTPLVAPEFSDGFGLTTPSGRDVTGLGKIDDKVLVFTDREVYAITGRGPNDDGSADDHSGMVLLSGNFGCVNQYSVVSYANGVFFESAGGLSHVDRGLKVTHMGEAADNVLADYPDIVDVCVWRERDLVIWAANNSLDTAGVLLVYDYSTNNWCDWLVKNDNADQVRPLAVCVHEDELYLSDGSAAGGSGYLYKSSDKVSVRSDDTANWIPMEIETAWIQSAGQSGWQRIKTVQVLGAWQDNHELKVSVYHDFETGAPETQLWTDAQLTSFTNEDVREQVQMRLTRQKTQAVKIRVEDARDGAGTFGFTAGPTIAGLMLEIGQKKGAAKMPAEQRK